MVALERVMDGHMRRAFAARGEVELVQAAEEAFRVRPFLRLVEVVKDEVVRLRGLFVDVPEQALGRRDVFVIGAIVLWRDAEFGEGFDGEEEVAAVLAEDGEVLRCERGRAVLEVADEVEAGGELRLFVVPLAEQAVQQVANRDDAARGDGGGAARVRERLGHAVRRRDEDTVRAEADRAGAQGAEDVLRGFIAQDGSRFLVHAFRPPFLRSCAHVSCCARCGTRQRSTYFARVRAT